MASTIYTVKWSKWDEYGSIDGHLSPFVAKWYDLHDATKRDRDNKIFQITDPVVTKEIQSAGSMTFSVPPTHYYYQDLKEADLSINIAVYRNGEFFWGGHPTTIDEDIYGTLSYTLEGALGYLSDIRYIPFDFAETPMTIENMFTYFFGADQNSNGNTDGGEYQVVLSNAHDLAESLTTENADDCVYLGIGYCEIASSFRYFDVSSGNTEDYVFANSEYGNFIPTGADGDVSSEITRSSGKALSFMDILKDKFLDYFGGVVTIGLVEDEDAFSTLRNYEIDEHGYDSSGNFMPRRGIWSLHWESTADKPNQTATVGVNVLTKSRTVDYTDVVTAIAPVDDNGNSLLTNAQLIGGSSYIDYAPKSLGISKYTYKPAESVMFINLDMAEKYGIIAEEYVLDGEYSWQEQIVQLSHEVASQLTEPVIEVEIQCIDMALLDDNVNPIDVGTWIKYVDNSRNEVLDTYVTSMTINLSNPAENTISIGSSPKKLTSKIK